MGKKFIPNGDLDFVTKAEQIARAVAAEPGRFEISQADSDALSAAVKEFRAVLQACNREVRSRAMTRRKEQARSEAEQIIRRLAHHVRANPRVDDLSRMILGIPERCAKAKSIPCPKEPPRLKFVRALHDGSGVPPIHELVFRPAQHGSTARPAGAVRLELFIDLISPDEPIPAHPSANYGSRAWYLRSYTRSPIRLAPPMPRVPMRVIYWGRWADSTGRVGPFSATAVGWVEGESYHLMGPELPGIPRRLHRIEDARVPGPANRARTYSVALLEVQYRSFNENELNSSPSPAIEQREAPQLESAKEAEDPAEKKNAA